jgi:hypothetical protein
LGSLADLEEKIRPINALHLPKSRPSPDPDHGHSIRCIEERVVEDGAKGRVRLRLGNAMDAGDADVALGSALNRALEDGDGGAKVEGMHADAEDVDARREGIHRGSSVSGSGVFSSQNSCGAARGRFRGRRACGLVGQCARAASSS